MKKMRKIFAVLLTLAMVLAMSIPTFAAKVTNQYTDKITVTNLAADVDTTLKLYNIIYLDQDDAGNQTWKVVDWAKDFVSEVTADGEFKVTDADGLRNAADADTTTADVNVVEHGTSHEFTGLPIGAYVIRAFDEKGTYSLMVANTYNKDGAYMASRSADVVAKMSGYNVKKEAEDKFVHRGQRVNFTVTTQMASKTNAEGKDLKKFKVIDTSKGLKEDSFILDSVVIAGTEKKANVDASKISATTNDKGEVVYTVDLSDFIKTTEAGATIVVKYSAIVEDDHKYNNSVTVDSDTVQYGGGNVDGFMGNVTLKKVDTNHNILNGAEFQLLKVTPAKEGAEATKTPVNVVRVKDGEYKVALDNEEGVTNTLVATKGRLKVTGLDEGNYEFKETKAPVGYKVNSNNTAFTITANEKTEVTVDAGEFVNTKLSALPSTGGIGTTIFTIAGCLIMVTAAGLFFASRKKANK